MLSRTILFVFLASALGFAQSGTSQQNRPFLYRHHVYIGMGALLRVGAPTDYHPTAAEAGTLQIPAPFTRRFYDEGASSASRRLRPLDYSHAGCDVSARAHASAQLVYRSVDYETRCFDQEFKPFQHACCRTVREFDRPALNRLQKLIIHAAMQHYGLQGGQALNRECVRSLSCGTLYQQSVLQRLAVKPPNDP